MFNVKHLLWSLVFVSTYLISLTDAFVNPNATIPPYVLEKKDNYYLQSKEDWYAYVLMVAGTFGAISILLYIKILIDTR